MGSRNRILTILLSAGAMIMLILDSKTAINGAVEGINICLQTIIPSLLPFFLLSIMLTNAASGLNITFLRPLGKLCGMPRGSEHIFLIGLLGGYPVGAQTVTEAYNARYLTEKDAHRLLGFCSNAGPAFVFGIVGSLFPSKITALLLWLINIVSALIVGIILPGKSNECCTISRKHTFSFTNALVGAVRITGIVCGWIIVFRVLIAFLCRWLLWILPEPIKLLTIGLLELANGCYSLQSTQSEAMRFILCSVFLGFGGTCVGMQTISATGDLGSGWYFAGKIMQAIISASVSSIAALYLYNRRNMPSLLLIVMPALFTGLFLIFKKTVAFLNNRIYNS